MNHSVSGDVLRQFESAWDMLGDILQRVPDEHWRQDASHGLAPGRLAYHVLETAEYYMSGEPKSFRWGARFGVDWEAATPEELPERENLIDYLAEIRTTCQKWLGDVEDSSMLALDSVYGSEGMSRLEVGLYLMRHTHHHIGELCGHLRRCGIARPSWR